MLKKWIREFLGIQAIVDDIHDLKVLTGQNAKHNALLRGAVESGMGRVLAKLDPMLGTTEDDPARKQESDRLGKEIINKLKAEQAVRDHYGYSDPR